MKIDLSLLHSRSKDSIDISGNYSLPKEYFSTYKEIIEISNINVTGNITIDSEEDDYIKALINGDMFLEDSISLDPIKYSFSIEYDDKLEQNCKNNENTLDIFSFLWENIVLEVPLQYTKVSDLSKFHGDGWKLISEEERTIQDNPFSELLKDFNKEE